jgi:hypothetical protein
VNVGVRHDQTTCALDSHAFYPHKFVCGALYRAELSRLLEERLGLEIERRKSWFELKGVPDEERLRTSKRRNAIEAELVSLRGSNARN